MTGEIYQTVLNCRCRAGDENSKRHQPSPQCLTTFGLGSDKTAPQAEPRPLSENTEGHANQKTKHNGSRKRRPTFKPQLYKQRLIHCASVDAERSIEHGNFF